jgi:hypothetical protein
MVEVIIVLGKWELGNERFYILSGYPNIVLDYYYDDM